MISHWTSWERYNIAVYFHELLLNRVLYQGCCSGSVLERASLVGSMGFGVCIMAHSRSFIAGRLRDSQFERSNTKMQEMSQMNNSTGYEVDGNTSAKPICYISFDPVPRDVANHLQGELRCLCPERGHTR